MNRGFPSPLETDLSAVGGGTPLFVFYVKMMYTKINKGTGLAPNDLF